MGRRKLEDKFYLVLSKSRNYTHGAFPFSEDGLEKAKKFIKEKSKQSKDALYIVEK